MSSQASSAGRGEAEVRQKLVESGAVDVMIDIRGNFFYTRTVPCQLWFFDREKERDETRRDRVLMLDARNVYRKVTRSIFDFSPEQQKNIAAIIWLYRGQTERFLSLIEGYLEQAIAEWRAATELLSAFEEALGKLIDLAEPFVAEWRDPDPLDDTWAELVSIRAAILEDINALTVEVATWAADWELRGNGVTRGNHTLHEARDELHDMALHCRDLSRQIDLVAKMADRTVDVAVKELDARKSALWVNADINRARRSLQEARVEAIEVLRQARYFLRQVDWLQERFPNAELRDVEGLVKAVDRSEIESQDWSLTPGRYVGVAPEKEEDFDFEEVLRSIHVDLNGLNEEAAALAVRIAGNFDELTI